MAKIKYDKDTFPTLAEGYALQGLSDEQIANNLGISTVSYYKYQKDFPKFFKAIKSGKAPVNFEVVNKLLQRAKGFEYDEVTKEPVIVLKKIKGKTVKLVPRRELTVVKIVTKRVHPDVGAIVFWLCNRMKGDWRQTTRIEIDPISDELQDVVKGMTKERLEYLLDSDLTKTNKIPSKKTTSKKAKKKKPTPKNKKKKPTPKSKKSTTPSKSTRRVNSKKNNKNSTGKA